MANKQNIRKALKTIEELSNRMAEGMYMDNAMDGSGECGSIIADGWVKWFNRQLAQVLADNGVTLQEVMETADMWANRELEMGPKKIFVSMYSRRAGMYKETDYLDTRWGNLVMTLHNTQQYA